MCESDTHGKLASGLRSSKWLCGSGSGKARTLWAEWPHLSSVTCWWAGWPSRSGQSRLGVLPGATPLSSSPGRVGVRGSRSPYPVPSQWNRKLPQPPGLCPEKDLRGWMSLVLYSHCPTFPSRQPRSREAGVPPGVRPWPAPRPAPGEAPDAAPLAPTRGRWAPPAICSEPSLDRPSRPAQQDFWHLGHRRQSRGQATQGGGRGGRGLAAGIRPAGGSALGFGLVRGAGGGNKGRAGCSQEEPGCQPARMGLLRVADGGLGSLHSPWDRVHPGGQPGSASVHPWQLPSRWGGG